jgi:hypothetical protein
MDINETEPNQPKPSRREKFGKEYFAKYYHDHKGYFDCQCGNKVMKCYNSKHIKTKKHRTFLKMTELHDQIQENEEAAKL